MLRLKSETWLKCTLFGYCALWSARLDEVNNKHLKS
jgi:hypothetical protein